MKKIEVDWFEVDLIRNGEGYDSGYEIKFFTNGWVDVEELRGIKSSPVLLKSPETSLYIKSFGGCDVSTLENTGVLCAVRVQSRLRIEWIKDEDELAKRLV